MNAGILFCFLSTENDRIMLYNYWIPLPPALQFKAVFFLSSPLGLKKNVC